MGLLAALIVATLTGAGFYLLMKRNLYEVLLGLTLLAHGINMFLLMMGGWSQAQFPPYLEGKPKGSDFADPLPQALILTAIVISFGVTAYLVVLVARGYEETENAELGEEGREEGEP